MNAHANNGHANNNGHVHNTAPDQKKTVAFLVDVGAGLLIALALLLLGLADNLDVFFGLLCLVYACYLTGRQGF